MIALSAVLPAGATDDAYQWTINSPSGKTTYIEGERVSFSFDEDGEWKIHLEVYYLHQSPFGPWLWVAVTGTTYTNVIFEDGFETGTTGEWSATIGGTT